MQFIFAVLVGIVSALLGAVAAIEVADNPYVWSYVRDHSAYIDEVSQLGKVVVDFINKNREQMMAKPHDYELMGPFVQTFKYVTAEVKMPKRFASDNGEAGGIKPLPSKKREGKLANPSWNIYMQAPMEVKLKHNGVDLEPFSINQGFNCKAYKSSPTEDARLHCRPGVDLVDYSGQCSAGFPNDAKAKERCNAAFADFKKGMIYWLGEFKKSQPKIRIAKASEKFIKWLTQKLDLPDSYVTTPAPTA